MPLSGVRLDPESLVRTEFAAWHVQQHLWPVAGNFSFRSRGTTLGRACCNEVAMLERTSACEPAGHRTPPSFPPPAARFNALGPRIFDHATLANLGNRIAYDPAILLARPEACDTGGK